MVKIFEDMFTRFDRMHERDGQTDRRRTTAYTALVHSISRGKKMVTSVFRNGTEIIH